MMTGVTRAVTNSEFDHVAVIIRLADEDDVFYIEATGGPGVSMRRWDNLKKNVGDDKFYKKIVYRHVNYDQTGEQIDKFWEFTRQALGHKYEISPDKLMRK